MGIESEIWSVTSFNELYKEGIEKIEKEICITNHKSYVEDVSQKTYQLWRSQNIRGLFQIR